MTTARPPVPIRNILYDWEGKDKLGKSASGEIMAGGTTVAAAILRRQGIEVTRLKKKPVRRDKKITAKDVALFTRQLATMLKAGVPLLQAFDIVAKGQTNPAFVRLIRSVRSDVEGGTSLNQAFARHPRHFDALFCHLVAAGEQAGLLDELLESLARYKEKNLAIKSKVRAALTYPAAIVAFAIAVTAIIMIWVVPSFKEVFASVGAELPLPTRIVIAISNFLSAWWWALCASTAGALIWFLRAWRRSALLQEKTDRLALQLPLFGTLIRKAALTRWSRTLAAMSAAGVPLVEALGSVGGATGNAVYASATERIRSEVNGGTSLTMAIGHTGLFPDMVVQMVAIGEESGALDQMLVKVADFYEIEVNEALVSLSSLMEPFIMLVLGIVIGGLVIAMYLPIFKLGSVI